MPFQQAIGSGVRGVDYTVVSYTDKDGNPVTLHKRKDGTIVDPATNAPVDTEAMGYTLTSDVVEETAAPKAQVQTARLLNQDGAADKKDVNQETSIRIGGEFADPAKGERPGTIVGGKMAGFTVLDIPGQIPGTLGTLATAGKYAFGEPYPDNATLGIVTDNIITPISGANYNKFKEGNYMDKAVVERTERNVAIAGQLRSKYGQPFATSGGARTASDIADESAKSNKAIEELAKALGVDYDDIANNPFGGGKNYKDAIKKATEAAKKDPSSVYKFFKEGEEITNKKIERMHQATIYAGAVADTIGPDALGGYDQQQKEATDRKAMQDYLSEKQPPASDKEREAGFGVRDKAFESAFSSFAGSDEDE